MKPFHKKGRLWEFRVRGGNAFLFLRFQICSLVSADFVDVFGGYTGNFP